MCLTGVLWLNLHFDALLYGAIWFASASSCCCLRHPRLRKPLTMKIEEETLAEEGTPIPHVEHGASDRLAAWSGRGDDVDLYLMQHGQATTEAEDARATLTDAAERRAPCGRRPGPPASGSASACTAKSSCRADSPLLVARSALSRASRLRPGLAPMTGGPLARWLRARPSTRRSRWSAACLSSAGLPRCWWQATSGPVVGFPDGRPGELEPKVDGRRLLRGVGASAGASPEHAPTTGRRPHMHPSRVGPTSPGDCCGIAGRSLVGGGLLTDDRDRIRVPGQDRAHHPEPAGGQERGHTGHARGTVPHLGRLPRQRRCRCRDPDRCRRCLLCRRRSCDLRADQLCRRHPESSQGHRRHGLRWHHQRAAPDHETDYRRGERVGAGRRTRTGAGLRPAHYVGVRDVRIVRGAPRVPPR